MKEVKGNRGKYLAICLCVLAVGCFLTFGATRAHYLAEAKVSATDFYGDYLYAHKDAGMISIVSGSNEQPEGEGRYVIYDKFSEISEEGVCTMDDQGFVVLHRKDKSIEEICLVNGTYFYMTPKNEPVQLARMSE